MASRKEFTAEDQNNLAQFLSKYPASDRKRPSVFKSLAEKHDEHTWQAWQNHYCKSATDLIELKIARLLKQSKQSTGNGQEQRKRPRAGSDDDEDDRVKPRTAPHKSARTPFTDEDRDLLVKALAKAKLKGMAMGKTYEMLGTKHPHHTAMSWQTYTRNNRADIERRVEEAVRSMRKKREVSFPSSVEVTQSPPPPRKKRKRDPSLVMQPAVASTSRAILPPSHQRSRSISSAVTDRQQHPSHAKGKQRAISSDYRATSVLSADQGLPVPANQKGKQRAISTDRHASSAAFSIDGESVMQDEKPFAQKQRSKTRDSTNADSEEPDDFLTPEEAKEFIVLKLSYSELKGIDKAVVWQNLARMIPSRPAEYWERLYRKNPFWFLKRAAERYEQRTQGQRDEGSGTSQYDDELLETGSTGTSDDSKPFESSARQSEDGDPAPEPDGSNESDLVVLESLQSTSTRLTKTTDTSGESHEAPPPAFIEQVPSAQPMPLFAPESSSGTSSSVAAADQEPPSQQQADTSDTTHISESLSLSLPMPAQIQIVAEPGSETTTPMVTALAQSPVVSPDASMPVIEQHVQVTFALQTALEEEIEGSKSTNDASAETSDDVQAKSSDESLIKSNTDSLAKPSDEPQVQASGEPPAKSSEESQAKTSDESRAKSSEEAGAAETQYFEPLSQIPESLPMTSQRQGSLDQAQMHEDEVSGDSVEQPDREVVEKATDRQMREEAKEAEKDGQQLADSIRPQGNVAVFLGTGRVPLSLEAAESGSGAVERDQDWIEKLLTAADALAEEDGLLGSEDEDALASASTQSREIDAELRKEHAELLKLVEKQIQDRELARKHKKSSQSPAKQSPSGGVGASNVDKGAQSPTRDDAALKKRIEEVARRKEAEDEAKRKVEAVAAAAIAAAAAAQSAKQPRVMSPVVVSANRQTRKTQSEPIFVIADSQEDADKSGKTTSSSAPQRQRQVQPDSQTASPMEQVYSEMFAEAHEQFGRSYDDLISLHERLGSGVDSRLLFDSLVFFVGPTARYGALKERRRQEIQKRLWHPDHDIVVLEGTIEQRTELESRKWPGAIEERATFLREAGYTASAQIDSRRHWPYSAARKQKRKRARQEAQA